MKFKNILYYFPDNFIINKIIIYLTSIYFHKSPFFYFSNSLNGYILRNKSTSSFLSKYVNKITAKEYISEKVGIEHVVKTLKLYDGQVPNLDSWVFKSNNDFSGALLYNNLKLIDVKKNCFDHIININSDISLDDLLTKFITLNRKSSPFEITRESCYKNIKKQYFFEEFIPPYNDDGSPVNEYKFHCINGKVSFVYLVYDRNGYNKRIIFDTSKKPLPFIWSKKADFHKFEIDSNKIILSENFDLMISLAEKLSVDFKYVRVDIYDINPNPKVGELTFFHGSGLERILPVNFDYEFGAKL